MDEQTELLREMRDFLRIMAEPALAERDKKLRASLREIIGKSKRRAEVVLLMNGLRTKAELSKESGMDQGDVSRLVAALRAAELLKADDKHPELVISLPANFFENLEELK